MAEETYGEFRSFPSTHWSFVDEAAQTDAEAGRKALGALVVRYLPALRAHLVLKKRIARDEAEELLLAFVASKFVEEELVAKADRQRGRFRTFLLTALDRFVANRMRDATAKKRSPADGRLVPLDEHVHPAETEDSPARAFDVAWARQVISQCLGRMQEECQASDRPDIWDVFECRLLGPALDGTRPVPYEVLAKRFGFASPTQASNVLVTAKRMFERTMRAVVGEYVAGEKEIDEEIADLRRILARTGA